MKYALVIHGNTHDYSFDVDIEPDEYADQLGQYKHDFAPLAIELQEIVWEDDLQIGV